MIELIYRRADEFDVLHFHIDYFPFSLFSRQRTPFLTTLHGRLDMPEFKDVYELLDAPFVSISDSQRRPIPRLNWVRTVLHGMPANLLQPTAREAGLSGVPRPHLAGKGRRQAIRIAGARRHAAEDRRQGRQRRQEVLRRRDQAADRRQPVGRIHRRDQRRAEAGIPRPVPHALLFPIDWPEPFGLVMIEAMACGTPVVAFNRGSVPEVIDDGVTGFIVHDEAQAVAAVDWVHTLDRTRVRNVFDRRFSARRMAEDYVDVYQSLMQPARRLRAVTA